MFRKCCGGRRSCRFPIGPLLISIGSGILLAYIIPYYILIIMLGIALVIAGIWFVGKK